MNIAATTASPAPSVAVTKPVKPVGGKYQTATQVKGLSPVIFNVGEVDSFHLLEDSMIRFNMARDGLLSRGLRPWYDTERKRQELGRPGILLVIKGIGKQSEKERMLKRYVGSRTYS